MAAAPREPSGAWGSLLGHKPVSAHRTALNKSWRATVSRIGRAARYNKARQPVE